ncbi:MAG: neutral zinc metallopeptidase [Rhodocyclaceae bacterium]|nr:neutral zinc metallopeptidase [Rhodocyclaceae bacterium]
MRLDREETSHNIEDRRGMRLSGAGKGGMGLGAVVLALVASYFFGIDTQTALNIASGLQGGGAPAQAVDVPSQRPDASDEMATFVAKVLGSTERVWSEVFTESGSRYAPPKLVLFSDQTPTACGAGDAAMGPFYCPGDQKVYIDLEFFRELHNRFHAPGDFAQAYVIAHEIGHHVQNLLGISTEVQRARQNARNQAQSNLLSVRLELQADCFAGVWAHRADESRNILEEGDLEEAIAAAAAVGDDTLQKQATGRVVPDAFTHGSAQQRVYWFKQGMKTGDLNQCNTFEVRK